jgi:diguanylate cyclase (GGDEF)-like protein
MNIRQDKAVDMLLALGDPAERRTKPQLLDSALRTTLALMEADGAAILNSASRSGARLVLHAGSSTPATLLAPKGSEVTKTLAGSAQPLVLADLLDEPRFSGADGCPGVEAGPTVFAALRQRNMGPAYVAAYRRRGRARFTALETRLLVSFSAWLGTALDFIRLTTGTEKVAVTDDLTDVYNFRFLKTALNREIRRASRFGQELSVAHIAVDDLASQVAEHGELRSNLVVKEVATVLAQQVRSFDVLGRYGEEAFMLILPQTGRDGATEAAERMRLAVERHAFSSSAAGAITASVGIASFPQDAADLGDLVAAAERALHQARQRGPNTVATLGARKAA